MENVLNITNGDCAKGIMKKANIPGVFLPWRDVLHDGPVPEGLSLAELSNVRAEFIISRGWGTPDQKLTITPMGKNVLAGKRSWLEMVELDRWIGGVHLTHGNMWCWDSGILRYQEG